MTSRDLVPQGLPHGERKKTEAGMREAGVPVTSSPAPSQGLPPGGGASPPPSPASPQAAGLGSFDALAAKTPAVPFGAVPQGEPPPDPLARLRESPNAMMREIAELIPNYTGS